MMFAPRTRTCECGRPLGPGSEDGVCAECVAAIKHIVAQLVIEREMQERTIGCLVFTVACMIVGVLLAAAVILLTD